MLPCTTMSMPFIEMPQRAAALPSIDEKAAASGGARILAGVALDARRRRTSCSRRRRGRRMPCTITVACLFMPAQ